MTPELDDDGYPTEDTLVAVETWNCVGRGPKLSFMEFIKKVWWMPDWGWSEEEFTDEFRGDGIRYNISTGGWSGNESLISAMQSNILFWSLCWVQSRRGGHYIFEVTV